MKLTRSVKAAETIETVVETGYGEAVEYIKAAIDCLGEIASNSGDESAKEAIANLGVILLDLK